MNFFFDNMMSPKLARVLEILHGDVHLIRHLRDGGRFQPGATDEEWIGSLCRDPEPWAVVSGDLRMLGRPHVLAELHRSNNVFLCMDDHWCLGNSQHSQTWKLLKVWPEIVAFASQPGPLFFEVRTAGNNPKVEELRLSRRAKRRRLRLKRDELSND